MSESNTSDWLEAFWSDLLSEEPTRVAAAWSSLQAADERQAVRDHLHKMATEAGWADVQRQAARAALAVIAPESDDA
jgi:HPt (histidine-containing phosphotransfer) domain-containing protein